MTDRVENWERYLDELERIASDPVGSGGHTDEPRPAGVMPAQLSDRARMVLDRLDAAQSDLETTLVGMRSQMRVAAEGERRLRRGSTPPATLDITA